MNYLRGIRSMCGELIFGKRRRTVDDFAAHDSSFGEGPHAQGWVVSLLRYLGFRFKLVVK